MTDGLLPIGAFSRASLLSVKALRAYHDAGVLVPARVDPDTGYRTYSATQLADAAVLRRLREIDLPLSEVRQILRGRDPELTRKILTEHAHLMQERLAHVTAAVSELQASVEHPSSQTPVHLDELAATAVVERRGRVTETDFASFLDDAYPRLYQAAATVGLVPNGPPGALYPPEMEELNEVVAYVPVDGPAERTDGVLPPVRVAVLTHVGAYDRIGDSYRLLGAWVAEHVTPVPQPVRENYVVGPDATSDPDRYRTDICWPVS